MGELLRRLFYIRYPAVCLVALLGFGPLATRTTARELLANVLLVHTFGQVLALTVICLTAAKLFLVQAGVILFNGPSRFKELTPAPVATSPAPSARWRIGWSWSACKTIFWLVAGLAPPVAAVWHSVGTRAAPEKLHGFLNTVDWSAGLAGLVCGMFLYLFLLLLVAVVEHRLVAAGEMIPGLLPVRVESPGPPGSPLWRIDGLARWIGGPGYTETGPNGARCFRPGHWQQVVVLGFLIAAYLVLRWGTAGSTALPAPPLLPTLFFAILELALISTVLAGTSFFLDYYRLSVVVVLLLAIAVNYKFSARDDTFATPERNSGKDPPELLDLVPGWAERIPVGKSGKRTLVVVTAPGGGIHAAAWTAQVLTGLHYRYGGEFANSLCLVSAVSGGSVGTMYYAANLDVLNDAALQSPGQNRELWEQCRRIVERAGGSGLEAIGWGLVFCDLPNAVPFVKLAGDRGTTLDECWESRLHLSRKGGAVAWSLRDWCEPVRDGKMPVVVFNSTEIESGRRVLYSPVHSTRRKSLEDEPDSQAAPVEFSRTYPTRDLRIATAARLSATFPYVSPAATSADLDQLGHMADGGYADNEGIETAVDWIGKVVDSLAVKDAGKAPFERILILRIRHQIPSDPLADGDKDRKRHARDGFEYAVFGPLKALTMVRGTSQIERGQVEVDFLRDVPAKLSGLNAGITIESKYLDYLLADNDHSPPLSWKLSPAEFVLYEEAWKKLMNAPAIQELDRDYFSVKRQ